MFVVSIVFDRKRQNVLMLYHFKQEAYNFPGGKVDRGENLMDASYRELFEETGITKDDVKLHFVRYERVTLFNEEYRLYITTGVLNKDVQLVEEKNPLYWIRITDRETLINAYRDGNAYTFFLQALQCLEHVEEKEGTVHAEESALLDA